MSDQIYTLANGKESMAYIGPKPWHGLGQSLTEDASVDEWVVESGMDWRYFRAQVEFVNEGLENIEMTPFSGQTVLYRSDTGEPLSIVSENYKIVQPREVLEFFRSFAEAGDMTIETAGSLFNGKKIWALARLNKDFTIGKDDYHKPYALLATSCDKSLSTTGRLTLVRVVCNNTLTAATSSNKGAIKVPHNAHFKPEEVKREMGLVVDGLNENIEKMEVMHKTTVNDTEAISFFLNLLKSKEEKKSSEVDIKPKARTMARLWESYKNAPGAEDTAFGLVQAVTHSVDFNPNSRDVNTRLNSAWFGSGDALKTKAFQYASDIDLLSKILEAGSLILSEGFGDILGDVLSQSVRAA